MEGEPAEAFQAGLGLIDDFGFAGVPTLGMVLDGVELELGEESDEERINEGEDEGECEL